MEGERKNRIEEKGPSWMQPQLWLRTWVHAKAMQQAEKRSTAGGHTTRTKQTKEQEEEEKEEE